MKSLVLLSFLSMSPGESAIVNPAEYFDNQAACTSRMQEIRAKNTAPGAARCICHKTVEEVSVEGSDAI